MSGRGDNNKKGTSGRGAGNQSTQGAAGGEKNEKAAHGRKAGTAASKPQQRTRDQSSDRNSSANTDQG